jgi:beta-galactosidase
VDRSAEQIDRDVAIMRGAGFNVVRMGDLSWDSFEPSQGKFSFEWFDKIMDKMHAMASRSSSTFLASRPRSGCIAHTRVWTS